MCESNKIICVQKKPEDRAKMFFGDYDGFIRTETVQFPIFQELAEASESNTWFVNEINYDADIVGWTEMPPHAQSKFEKNISYQNLMDSGVVKLFGRLAEIANIPELQYLYNRINTEENIHAKSYSNGISLVFGADAERVLDIAYTDEVIQMRVKDEVDGSEKLFDLYFGGKLNQIKKKLKNISVTNSVQTMKDIKEIAFGEYERTEEELDELKMALLQVIGAVYMLEGIKFPFSFFVTWTLNKAYGNCIQGFSRALKLIAWDEMTVHTVVGMNIINILRKDKSQGFTHLFKEYDVWLRNYAKTVSEKEFDWNDYLLIDGETPGYNKEIGRHFIKYWTDKRLRDVKLEDIYGEKKSDIIDGYNKLRDLNSTTSALQEADATNYMKGKLKDDLDRFKDFKGFSF